jgi:hypothetical protein
MPFFQSRPKVIHAEQYINGKETQGVQYKKRQNLITGKEIEIAFVTTIQGQEVLVKEGEWIIRESDNVHYYPCDATEFNKLYKPLVEREYND